MVYSSSWDASIIIGKEPTYIFKRQVLWVFIGIALAAGLSFFDYHKFEPFVVWLMLGVIALLLVVPCAMICSKAPAELFLAVHYNPRNLPS